MFGWWPKTFQVGFVCCHGARDIEASHWPFESWLPSCIQRTHQRLQGHKERLKPQVTIEGVATKRQVAAKDCKSHCLACIVPRTKNNSYKKPHMAMVIKIIKTGRTMINPQLPCISHDWLMLLNAAAAFQNGESAPPTRTAFSQVALEAMAV